MARLSLVTALDPRPQRSAEPLGRLDGGGVLAAPVTPTGWYSLPLEIEAATARANVVFPTRRTRVTHTGVRLADSSRLRSVATSPARPYSGEI